MSEIYADEEFEIEELYNKNLSIWIYKIKIVNFELLHLPPFKNFYGGYEYIMAKERFENLFII